MKKLLSVKDLQEFVDNEKGHIALNIMEGEEIEGTAFKMLYLRVRSTDPLNQANLAHQEQVAKRYTDHFKDYLNVEVWAGQATVAA